MPLSVLASACLFPLLLACHGFPISLETGAALLKDSADTECFSDGPYTFKGCCDSRHDWEHIAEVMAHTEMLHGNEKCWDDTFTYERCCALNSNIGKLLYTHLAWLLKSSGRKLTIFQGAVLDQFQEGRHLVPARVTIPIQGVQQNGEGILWAGRYAALMMELINFPFEPTPSRRFLEVASGVGAPSMAALARGFTVWSTDLRQESSWQRVASARASFGWGSPEVARLRTPTLDMLNMSTWPLNVLFDAILYVGPGSTEKVERMCLGFRMLVSTLLSPTGVALYVPQSEYTTVEGMLGRADYTCIRPDRFFQVTIHQLDGKGQWHSQHLGEGQVEDVRPSGRRVHVYSIQLLGPIMVSLLA